MHKFSIFIFSIMICLIVSHNISYAQDTQPYNYNIVDFKAPVQTPTDNLKYQDNYSPECNLYLQNALQNLDNADKNVELDYEQVKTQLIEAKNRVRLAKEYEKSVKDRLKLINKELQTIKSARNKVQYNLSIREKLYNVGNIIPAK